VVAKAQQLQSNASKPFSFQKYPGVWGSAPALLSQKANPCV